MQLHKLLGETIMETTAYICGVCILNCVLPPNGQASINLRYRCSTYNVVFGLSLVENLNLWSPEFLNVVMKEKPGGMESESHVINTKEGAPCRSAPYRLAPNKHFTDK